MKCILLALAILSAAPAQAKLSHGTYQVHIRPQLVGIYQDFRQILGNFTDYPPEVLQLLSDLDRLREGARQLKRTCPLRTTKDCLPALTTIQLELRALERLFIKYQGNTRFSAATGLSPISGQSVWLRLDEARARLLSTVDVEIFCLSAGRTSTRAVTNELIRGVDEIESFGDLLVVEFIPPKFQNDFRSAWMNFFRPLHRHAEIEGRVTFLTTNLEQLNFYWNLLNMRMTKRMKKTPEGMSGPLNAIQNRWNQIVRVNFGQ